MNVARKSEPAGGAGRTGRGRNEAAGLPARRGVTLPLVAVSMVALCGFVALAVDVGRVAVARVEAQAAADVAAMAAARSLNGLPPQNLATATAAAVSAVSPYQVLGQTLGASNVAAVHGTYRYNTATQAFAPQFTLLPGELYNLSQATVTVACSTTFARAFGVSAFNVSTTATAAHRPRDVSIVLDYSGSMNNESDVWNSTFYLNNGQGAPYNLIYTSNNAETVYPKFGHYTNEKNYNDYGHYANLLSPGVDNSNPLSGNMVISRSNISSAAQGVPAIISDFWQNNRGQTAASAFNTPADGNVDAVNQPNGAAGGDRYMFKGFNPGSGYATDVNDMLGVYLSYGYGPTWEQQGYSAAYYYFLNNQPYQGYTQGPRAWGKTFFIWPPDPRAPNDWRQLYFGTNDNTKLWDGNGNWKSPPGNYTINYKAILAWIKATPNPFPAQLRSGNTLFYGSIPNDIQSSAYDFTQPNANIANQDQRFWKCYIDYALGNYRDEYGNVNVPQNEGMSYGPDFTYGTVQISPPPQGNGKGKGNGGPQQATYMDYNDNPLRPRHRMWFGPLTMIQFMLDAGLLPGTAHDIATYPMKSGVGGALLDIQANHPNDLVSMSLYSRPQYNNDPSGVGSFNLSQYSLTANYQAIINSLWVPPNSGTTDVRPWDANGLQTPRAHDDFSVNTASSYGMMLAYNQLSSSPTLRALDQGAAPGVGGLGRVGAQRLVIYETDGMANIDSIPGNGFYNAGGGNSYYQILPGQPLYGNYYSETALFQSVQNICNNADGTPGNAPGYGSNQGYPGYSTPSKPVRVETIAFGTVFEVPSAVQNYSVYLLNEISAIGGTVFPSSPNDAANGYKWCTGTLAQRQGKLRQAFTNIMNSGIPITLVK